MNGPQMRVGPLMVGFAEFPKEIEHQIDFFFFISVSGTRTTSFKFLLQIRGFPVKCHVGTGISLEISPLILLDREISSEMPVTSVVTGIS